MYSFIRPARALLAASPALCSLACGGAQSPPTAPTTSGTRSLSISGATTLNRGATSQLTVTETAGTTSGTTTTTPASVVWQTHDTGVATVSAAGVLTAVSVGKTLVSATADGLLAQSVVTVESTTTGAPGAAITACGTITAPGSYVLVQDLGGTSPCVSFSNTANVQLDCQGHSVNGLTLSGVSGATVQGCTVSDKLTLTSVTSVTLSRSTVQSDVVVNQSSSVIIADDTLSSVRANASSGVQVLRDTVATFGALYGVWLTGGMNNQVLQSTFSGGWTGSGETGSDDGVLLVNETGDTIQNNTITNFFDMAVEGADAVSNTTIADNTASNLGNFGIGSGWCTAWTNNIVRGNHISNAERLGWFKYELDGLHCGLTVPSPTFTGNQFIGNVFRNSTVPISSVLEVDMSGNVSGNLVQGNDFGPNNGPYLNPLSGFIDGGGNVCGPTNPVISNCPCTGGVSTSRARR
jgi:Right handed beta helix region/Bacterial Ig-like domain (group 2)